MSAQVSTNPNRHKLIKPLMVLLILLASFSRLWQLAQLPPGFWYDEAFNALDALSLLEGGWGQVFLAGNGGRATLFHHLGALALALFGQNTYSFRLIAVLFSILSVALMYRWLIILLAQEPHRYWIALAGASGLAFSFWYLILSRTGYRGAIIPAFFLLTATAFCYGWQRKSWPYMVVAGFFLGLSQYIYQPARLFPLVFGGFVIVWGLSQYFQAPTNTKAIQPSLKQAWLWLLGVALSSFIIFLPLGWYFYQYPEALFGHTSSVSVFSRIAEGQTTYLAHFWEAFTVFLNGSAMHWQRNIVGESGFGWFSQFGFWLGVGIALWRWKKAAYQFLLVSLVITWLPGPLGVPAVDSLHVSGMYPTYYALMGLGWFTAFSWLGKKIKLTNQAAVGVFTFITICVLSGGLTLYTYFWRWGPNPNTYYAYEAHVTDLVAHLSQLSRSNHVLIPFDFYTFPPTLFHLKASHPETNTAPSFSSKPLIIVTGPDGKLPTGQAPYLWLGQAETGKGESYMLPFSQIEALLTQNPSAIANPLP